MTSRAAIEADDLVKHFGDTVAVDGVSFAVPEGWVLGLLGPNGAGKTTTVRMLTTMSRPTSGTGRVAGHDIVKEPEAVRRSMGLTGQVATVDELLTGRENIRLIGGSPGSPKPRSGGSATSCSSGSRSRTRRTGREDLLRRHAPPARPGGLARRHATGAVPRRADDRARPPEPHRAVGGPAWPGRRRDDAAADDAVPRGGRPARGRHHRHRQGPDHRPGHPHPAEGPGRARERRAHRHLRRRPRQASDLRSRITDEVHVDRGARRITAKAGGLPDMLAMGEAIAAAGITSTTSGCCAPASTTSSCT